jgi:hypothetical protein
MVGGKSWIIIAIVSVGCAGISSAQPTSGRWEQVTDPNEIARVLEERRKQSSATNPWDQFPRYQGQQTDGYSLPPDVPAELRRRLQQCSQTSTGDPREFLRCQDALRDYDAFICQTHVKTETGPAYSQCRADLVQMRELNRLRSVTQPPEIRCKRQVDDSVVCN